MLARVGCGDDVICSTATQTNLVEHEISDKLSQWRLCRLKSSLALEGESL